MSDSIRPRTFHERIDEITTTNVERKELIEWVARLQCRNFTLTAGGDSLSDRIDELNATIKGHEAAACDIMSENAILRETNADIADQRKDRQFLQIRCDQAETERNLTRGKYDIVCEHRSDLQKENRELRDKLNRENKLINQYQSTISNLTKQNLELIDEVNTIKDRISRAYHETVKP